MVARRMNADLHNDRLRAMGAAAASLAHELRSPLSAMSLQCEISLSRPGLDDSIRGDLELLAKNVRRMTAMIRNSLDFASPQQPSAEVRLADVIEKLKPYLSIRLRHAGVKLRVDLPEELATFEGRELELGQALVNLTENAMLVMQGAGTQDPEITIRAEETPEELFLRVEDNGPGFDPAIADTAFDDFSSGREGGPGLGLGICRRIVRGHGGDVTIESPANPTCVTIRLPLDRSLNPRENPG
jgi:two-component system sensor histidine kinase DctS